MRDPAIRSYAESPPYVGGGLRVRYRWPDPSSRAVRKVREQVQEGGRALYVLYDPILDSEVLVEALYADEIWNENYRRQDGGMLDPFQYDDFQRGGLVTLIPFPSGGPLHESRWPVPNDRALEAAIAEIRQFNRSARRDLKRNATESYHAQELEAEARRKDEESLAVADEIAEGVGRDLHFATSIKSFVPRDIGEN